MLCGLLILKTQQDIFTPTLSKREIFMAFIVAESTKMGGPSSNTSLMNSLPLRRSTRKKWENAATHRSRGRLCCFVVWNMFRCLVFTREMLRVSISAGWQPNHTPFQLSIVMALSHHYFTISLIKLLVGRTAALLCFIAPLTHHPTHLMILR